MGRSALAMGDAPTRSRSYRTVPIVSGIAGIAGVVALSWGGSHLLGGAISDWMQAVATMGAFAAAVVAAWYAAGVVQVEQQRDAERDASAVRGQAEKVAAWVELGTPTWTPDGNEEFMAILYVRNSSDLPVYDMRININYTLRIDGGAVATAEDYRQMAVAPPGPVAHADDRGVVKLKLPPEAVVLSQGERSDLIQQSVTDRDVDIQFRDTSGRVWQRSSTGEVTQTTAPTTAGGVDFLNKEEPY